VERKYTSRSGVRRLEVSIGRRVINSIKKKFDGQKMRMKVDISDYTIERILLMKYKNG